MNLPVRDGINCGAHNRYGFPSCRDQLVSNVLQAAKAGPAKPVSKRRNNYSGDGYWFPGPNANLPDLRVAVFCLPPTRFFCDNELASLRCCDVSFCDVFVWFYFFHSKTDIYKAGGHVLLTKTDCFLSYFTDALVSLIADLSVSFLFFALCNFLKLLLFLVFLRCV